jgi:hypothetical protein
MIAGCHENEDPSDAATSSARQSSMPAIARISTTASGRAAPLAPAEVRLKSRAGVSGSFTIHGVACFGDEDELRLSIVADCPSYGAAMIAQGGEPRHDRLKAGCPNHKLIAVAFSERPKVVGSYGDIKTLAIVVSGGDERFSMAVGAQKTGKGVVFTTLSATLAEGQLDVEAKDGEMISGPFTCTITSS